VSVAQAADWPEAAGPNHDFKADGTALTSFSVSRNDGVLWRTPLPNTGESTPIVSGDRIFVTCHAPTTGDSQTGSTILGICFDRKTGKELWRRELPGARETDMASGFSDNTAASPVTDGKYVCFTNVGGSLRTFDFDGNLVWKHDWVMFGRHHARQHEPILHNGKVIVLKTMAEGLAKEATTKGGAKKLGTDENVWTRLQAFDLATGKRSWVAESATSVHSLSMLGKRDGTPAILTGRGGGHAPPEKPYGISLINADTGKTIWDKEIKGYAAHHNAVFTDSIAGGFIGKTHQTIDIATGNVLKTISTDTDIQLRRRVGDGYDVLTTFPSKGEKKQKKALTYHTNIIIGDYHYFRSFAGGFLGRVNLKTSQLEYLQVPVQVVRKDGQPDEVLWDKALENDVKNNDGFVVYTDKRAKLSGWGHVSAASPIVVGDHLYMPTMIGMVYVVKWNAAVLDETAIVSISDLGPAQQTWTLSSLAYADGRIYARTLKELICIGK
jgi:outer membrane protein assembly factor BamB